AWCWRTRTLTPLPGVRRRVYAFLGCVVFLHGCAWGHPTRSSVPGGLVGGGGSVHNHPAEIVIYHRGSEIARHPRLVGQRDARHTLPGHHPTPTRASRGPALEEQLLSGGHASLERYAAALKQRAYGRGVRALRRLLELKRPYPSGPFLAAVEQALRFGLFDLQRLETLILKHVAGDFFNLDSERDEDA